MFQSALFRELIGHLLALFALVFSVVWLIEQRLDGIMLAMIIASIAAAARATRKDMLGAASEAAFVALFVTSILWGMLGDAIWPLIRP